ncbi:MAG: fumarate hydratase C-terminal domain-containing protein, partial [Comamonadaceae bacterium]|nr:fumarate hydratase C-terminal domain-containing protein [Comamonadaceae bacterium]
MKTVKLASAGFLDSLPKRGRKTGTAFRDEEWEGRLAKIAEETGLGAQFGGRFLAHETRFIQAVPARRFVPGGDWRVLQRRPELPGKNNEKRIVSGNSGKESCPFVERDSGQGRRPEVAVDLNRPIEAVLKDLSALPVGTMVKLSGPLVVARDIAHARLWKMFKETGRVPDYFENHPIYYAGPAKTPRGMASGSFG